MFTPLKKLWFVATKRADFRRNADKFHISPVLARLIRNRDIITDEEIDQYLNGTARNFHSPWHLKDMDQAVAILSDKITQKKKLRIIGDYDIDGVTASFILYKGLRRLGLDCSIRIPHRIHDGYGVNISMIEEAVQDGVDTILTCDNGIAARTELQYAKEQSLTVIVTDHHEVPYEMEGDTKKYLLPPADAIINPAQIDCCYEYKKICGAAVAWKLITALYETYHIPENEIEEFYELAAIATIGDVMELREENRILVREGLDRLPYTQNVGLRALIKETGLEGKQISAYHIGFVIGPCINAGGRLQTALLALELLQCEDPLEAEKKAKKLKEINEKRKALTESGLQDAIEWVEDSKPVIRDEKENSGGIDKVLVVYLPECHESIAGIIAGKLRERYNRPCFVLTKGKEGVKGSGRSIEEYSMYDELVKCKEFLTKFGGHPMAAGLSLPEENIKAFREMLNQNCTLTTKDLSEKIHIDMQLPFAMISESLIEELQHLEPFGKGNTKPSFACKSVNIRSASIVGKNRNVVRLKLQDSSGCVMDGVYFGEAEQFMNYIKGKNQLEAISYYPSVNEFNGYRNLQIILGEYR